MRFFTLKDILDKPEDNPEVQQAKREIMQSGIVPEILRRQQEPAYLKEEGRTQPVPNTTALSYLGQVAYGKLSRLLRQYHMM